MKLTSTKLPHKSLADVTLVPVETRSSEKMFRVDVGQHQAGFVTRFRDTRTEINPWKAFRGIPGRYVTAFYKAEGGIEAAVACVLDRSLS